MTKKRLNRDVAIPMLRGALIAPFLSFLYDVGAPVDRELSVVGLPSQILDRDEIYLPTARACEFVSRVGASQGHPELVCEVTRRVGIEGLSPEMSCAVRGAPTLYRALRVMCEKAHRESTHCRVKLIGVGETVRLYHRGSYPDETAGMVEAAWWRIGTLVAIVRHFLGPSWEPTRMGVPGESPRTLARWFPDTRLLVSHNEHWIEFPRGRLPSTCSLHASGEIAPDFAESLRALLRAYLPDGSLTIDNAAELSGTSVRTLQRRLAMKGLAYSTLVSEARFACAAQLLRKGGVKVIDAAYEAGYSDPSHFARAFRRIAGVSPRDFQNQLEMGA